MSGRPFLPAADIPTPSMPPRPSIVPPLRIAGGNNNNFIKPNSNGSSGPAQIRPPAASNYKATAPIGSPNVSSISSLSSSSSSLSNNKIASSVLSNKASAGIISQPKSSAPLSNAAPPPAAVSHVPSGPKPAFRPVSYHMSGPAPAYNAQHIAKGQMFRELRASANNPPPIVTTTNQSAASSSPPSATSNNAPPVTTGIAGKEYIIPKAEDYKPHGPAQSPLHHAEAGGRLVTSAWRSSSSSSNPSMSRKHVRRSLNSNHPVDIVDVDAAIDNKNTNRPSSAFRGASPRGAPPTSFIPDINELEKVFIVTTIKVNNSRPNTAAGNRNSTRPSTSQSNRPKQEEKEPTPPVDDEDINIVDGTMNDEDEVKPDADAESNNNIMDDNDPDNPFAVDNNDDDKKEKQDTVLSSPEKSSDISPDTNDNALTSGESPIMDDSNENVDADDEEDEKKNKDKSSKAAKKKWSKPQPIPSSGLNPQLSLTSSLQTDVNRDNNLTEENKKGTDSDFPVVTDDSAPTEDTSSKSKEKSCYQQALQKRKERVKQRSDNAFNNATNVKSPKKPDLAFGRSVKDFNTTTSEFKTERPLSPQQRKKTEELKRLKAKEDAVKNTPRSARNSARSNNSNKDFGSKKKTGNNNSINKSLPSVDNSIDLSSVAEKLGLPLSALQTSDKKMQATIKAALKMLQSEIENIPDDDNNNTANTHEKKSENEEEQPVDEDIENNNDSVVEPEITQGKSVVSDSDEEKLDDSNTDIKSLEDESTDKPLDESTDNVNKDDETIDEKSSPLIEASLDEPAQQNKESLPKPVKDNKTQVNPQVPSWPGADESSSFDDSNQLDDGKEKEDTVLEESNNKDDEEDEDKSADSSVNIDEDSTDDNHEVPDEALEASNSGEISLDLTQEPGHDKDDHKKNDKKSQIQTVPSFGVEKPVDIAQPKRGSFKGLNKPASAQDNTNNNNERRPSIASTVKDDDNKSDIDKASDLSDLSRPSTAASLPLNNDDNNDPLAADNKNDDSKPDINDSKNEADGDNDDDNIHEQSSLNLSEPDTDDEHDKGEIQGEIHNKIQSPSASQKRSNSPSALTLDEPDTDPEHDDDEIHGQIHNNKTESKNNNNNDEDDNPLENSVSHLHLEEPDTDPEHDNDEREGVIHTNDASNTKDKKKDNKSDEKKKKKKPTGSKHIDPEASFEL